ncbi:dihydroceramidase [Sporothrix brasiliensis 5110]|uniref:Dihydroceramidase n=1 Tax=Sporothrix brasiliensis 5110 TaxID=1398154 RepID=A0A0C2EXL6_9PEZI|nr:dihydroceramidase [Sporothrix brasiliensis 5110]KIH91374.1 dihydroceramidase [Sporothrix brasiliensis 5110]
MGSFLQIPYRESRHGLWGEQTSTLNWCEEDYNITYYCAEFVNSITNLMFIWLGIRGIRDCMRFRHRPVFVVACIGYIVVGLGSIAFHTTLKYSMQLADELPMIYATCIIGHATFSYGKSPTVSRLIGLGLFSLGLLITVVYHFTKEPVFHQVSFACLTIAVVFRSMYDMEKTLRPALKIRSPERESGLMRQMWKMCLSGIALFLVGFFIWNMDNIFCLYLRSWRDILLLPWAVVLEGHAWWHILTGLAYYFIMWRLWLHTCLDGKEDEFALQWKTALTSIPRVVPVSDMEPSDAAYKGRRLD